MNNSGILSLRKPIRYGTCFLEQTAEGVQLQNEREGTVDNRHLTYSEKVHMSGKAYREMALAEMANSTTFFGNSNIEHARRLALLPESPDEAKGSGKFLLHPTLPSPPLPVQVLLFSAVRSVQKTIQRMESDYITNAVEICQGCALDSSSYDGCNL